MTYYLPLPNGQHVAVPDGIDPHAAYSNIMGKRPDLFGVTPETKKKDGPSGMGELVRGIPYGAASTGLSTLRGLAELSENIDRLSGDNVTMAGDTWLGRFADRNQKALDASSIAPRDPDSIMGQLGQGVGAVGTFALGGVGGLAAKGAAGLLGAGVRGLSAAGTAGRIAGAGALGGAAGMDEAAQRQQAAREAGTYTGDNQGDINADFLSGAAGFSQALPIEALLRTTPAGKIFEVALKIPGVKRALGMISKDAPLSYKKYAMDSIGAAFKSGGAEAAQEAAEGLAYDAIERGFYNSSAEIGQSLVGDAALGGGVGAIVSGAMSAAGLPRLARARGMMRDIAKQDQGIEAWGQANLTEPPAPPAPAAPGQLLLPPPSDANLPQIPFVPPAAPAPELFNDTPDKRKAMTRATNLDIDGPFKVRSIGKGYQVVDGRGKMASKAFPDLDTARLEAIARNDEARPELERQEKLFERQRETARLLRSARETVGAQTGLSNVDFEVLRNEQAEQKETPETRLPVVDAVLEQVANRVGRKGFKINSQTGVGYVPNLNQKQRVALERAGVVADERGAYSLSDINTLMGEFNRRQVEARVAKAAKDFIPADTTLEQKPSYPSAKDMPPGEVRYNVVPGSAPNGTARTPVLAVVEERYDENGALLAQRPVEVYGDEALAHKAAARLMDDQALEQKVQAVVTEGTPIEQNPWVEPLKAERERRLAAKAAQVQQAAPDGPGIPIGLERNSLLGRDATERRLRETIAKPMFDEKLETEKARLEQEGKQIEKALADVLTRYNVPAVIRVFKNILNPQTGTQMEGGYNALKKLIGVVNDLPPNMPLAQKLARLADVMRHEIIHALFDAGYLGKADYQILRRFAQVRTRPDNGKTFYKDAFDRYMPEYSKRGYSAQQLEEAISEEAIAEAFRYWARAPRSVPAKPAGAFAKIWNWLKELISGGPTMWDETNAIFAAVRSGKIAERAAAQGAFKTAATGTRYSLDSTGKPVHPTVEGRANFAKWFDGSKIVDADDRPLVVYHGTSKDKDFSSFRVPRHGSWFTMDPESASQYAEENDSKRTVYDGQRFNEKNTAARVIPAYLSIKNPLVLEEFPDSMKTASNYNKAQAMFFEQAKRDGYDGVIINAGNIVVAFDAKQIKSAIGNNGGFDPNNKNIKYSMKPETNSTGKPIHPTEEGRENFWRWFGNSKIVDDNDAPLVVYHGTSDSIDEFIVGHPNRKDSGWIGDGIYASSDPTLAGIYSKIKPPGKAAPNVMPLYMHIENPYYATLADKQRLMMISQKDPQAGIDASQKFTQELIAKGHDGVILKYDPKDVGAANASMEIVAFDPKQIKSASGNSGAFSSDTANIKYSMKSPLYSMSAPYGQRVPPLGDNEVGNKLNEAAADTIGDRFRSKLQVKVEDFGGVKDDLITKFQDYMYPAKKMLTEIKEAGGKVTDVQDFYMRELLYHGRVGEAIRDAEQNLMDPILKMLKEGYGKVSFEELEKFLVARHATERNKFMREHTERAIKRGSKSVTHPILDGSGITDEEAAKILQELAPKMKALDEYGAMIDAIVKATNEKRVEYGLIPKFDYAKDPNLPQFKYYVPLRGFFEEDMDPENITDEARARIEQRIKNAHQALARSGGGFKVMGREDKAMTGRKQMPTDVLANLFMQHLDTLIRGEKNLVGQSFLEFVREQKKERKRLGLHEHNPPAEVLETIPTKLIVTDNGVVRKVANPMAKMRNDVLVVKENGDEVIIKINDHGLARAMNHLWKTGQSPSDGPIKFLGWVNRNLARLATQWNPEFILVNMIRDFGTAALVSQKFGISTRDFMGTYLANAPAIAKEIWAMHKGGKPTGEWGKLFDEMRKFGGTTEYLGLNTLEEQLKKIDAVLAKAGNNPAGYAMSAIKGLGGVIESANFVAENISRLVAYKLARDMKNPDGSNKYSQDRAAEIAKTITVNFNKGGELKTVMNSLFLFYNAALQGTVAIGSAIRQSPKLQKMIGGIFMAGFIMDMLNAAMSDDDEDGVKRYDKLQAWELEHNLIVPTFGLMDKHFLKVPMPFVFNSIFNGGRAIGQYFRSQNGYKMPMPMSAMDVAGSIIGTLAESANPLGGSQSFLNFVAPTIVDPFIDYTRNRDFAGRPIKPSQSPFGAAKPESQLYWANTTPEFVAISKWLNRNTRGTDIVPGGIDVSPAAVDYWFGFVTGSAGKFAQRTWSLATHFVPELVLEGKTDITANDIPFVRRFVGAAGDRQNMELYFGAVKEVAMAKASLKAAREAKDPEAMADVRERFGNVIPLISPVMSMDSQIDKLRGEIKKLKANDRMDADAKRTRIEALEERVKQLTGRVNKLYVDATSD